MKMIFSCTLYEGKGLNKKYNNLISTHNPTKEDIIKNLEFLRCCTGAARLSVDPEPELGPSELSVQYDGEKYLFTLLEYVGANGEMIIRGKANFNGGGDLIEFLSDGELYPPNAITTDFEFIKKVFLEFLETGNVSYDLMDRIY
ncbi:DUF6911 family protein [Rodentibacter pneumotropicus]|uniref:DUF6911 family protein n=1 Tax=Rodentibacter pneumotropicus TaxID=758 RepID=UPI00037AAF6F|nr:hypothetical protein [Rodentibacter pneumotropicus]MDC2824425.1 hypothetical protein [Rodentibacter pneumotropicus]MDC2826672.1 hypothetical protein [Rodentibacter pneumotropicus]OOF61621.1 hypothetical protein BH925_01450 [Rodentibacter pneumotropicus]